MIIECIDVGWGPEWPLKKIEADILDRYLAPLERSSQRTVLINSTWYSQYQHAKTLRWLRDHDWDRLVIVAMIDAAIPQSDWFIEFDRPIDLVGNYPGQHDIVYWAQVVHRHFEFADHASPDAIDTAFMCLNRKPHWHRRKLYGELESANLLDLGLVTMGQEGAGPAVRRIDEDVADNHLAPNGAAVQHGIPNDITSLGDMRNWRRCFLNVVTETVWDINANHFVSEKIFKPIVGKRPFLVYDSDGACTWLEQRDFQTYVDDFRDISDLDLRQPHNLTPFLSVLCQQPQEYIVSKFVDLLPKIEYNYNRFFHYVDEQLIKINQGIACQI